MKILPILQASIVGLLFHLPFLTTDESYTVTIEKQNIVTNNLQKTVQKLANLPSNFTKTKNRHHHGSNEFESWKEIGGRKKGGMFDFNGYHNVDTMYRWLDTMAQRNKDVCQIFSIGHSFENRPLKLLKIGLPLDKKLNGAGGRKKPSMFIDGGIHARDFVSHEVRFEQCVCVKEWASSSTACYIIKELLTKRKQNMDILREIDLYIIPMLNPDGYEYSRRSQKSRLWRKNRRKNHPDSSGDCMGTDLNRNWAVNFGGVGSDGDTCSEMYRGVKPFSEPETRAVRNFIVKNGGLVDWKIYLGLHTFGQAILTPWGYKDEQPPDYNDMKALGDKAASALKKVHGTSYRVGTATALLGPGSGGSDDWAKGSGHFKYAYTIELRDTGKFGFVLPEN